MSRTYRLEICETPETAGLYQNQDFPDDHENAGYDLFIPVDTIIAPGEHILVKLGISARLVCTQTLNDVHFWLLPRSSIYKSNLVMMNSMGLIDRGYRGELGAPLHNLSNTPVSLSRQQRLMQIASPDLGNITQVRVVKNLPETRRGIGGFGSTGK